jgi:chromosome segregation ATPase
VGADHQIVLASEIAELGDSIDRAAAATESMLAVRPAASANPDVDPALAEHQELSRQLSALRERVAVAQRRNDGPQALRAELGTLLFFATTLRADAEHWRSALADQLEEVERQRAAVSQERERLAAEREKLVRRRDALQSTILQTAARMAQQNRGECRRTLPVFTLGEGLTVCSVSVAYPRRGLRFAGQWLVTLGRSHTVLVRRE